MENNEGLRNLLLKRQREENTFCGFLSATRKA